MCIRDRLKMIAPSHGCIWRSHIDEIIAKYEEWTTYQTQEKAVVVFDSFLLYTSRCV